MGNAISIYNRASDIDSQETIPFDIFLDNIKTGYWQDIVLPIRLIKDKDERDKAKKKAPNVTVSGVFSRRKDDSILSHSGYIGIDIDNCDHEAVKQMLQNDRYIVAAFASISGRGLCIIIKVSPKKHREAFQGFCEYLYSSYNLVADPTSINPSRARFVSFDPSIWIADVFDQFAQYPKEKPPKKIAKVIYSSDDFQNVLKQIVARKLNIVESYYEWLRIGFSFVHKFGDNGREYFHLVSQYSSKYDPDVCDRQYTACLKHTGKQETTISTFYHYAKEAGCEIYSERTKTIASTASQGKKSGLKESQVEENLFKFEQIEGDDVGSIIKQVYETNIELNEDTLLEQLRTYMRHRYEIMKNEISRYIEINGKPAEQEDLNAIWLEANAVLPKVNYDYFDRFIRNKQDTHRYNPLKSYFNSLESTVAGDIKEQLTLTLKDGPHLQAVHVVELIRAYFPCITALFDCIATKDADYNLYFGAKWLVGMVSAVFGEHSPLMYILAGEMQNTGKTEWFRRLLPKELQDYFSDSKLDEGKDSEILMTQKILILDDEMGGKSKRDTVRLKEITSKQKFSLREPYGRQNVDLVRIAVLGGTSNDKGLLFDPTGNRRMIIIPVTGIDHKVYNSINKALLMAEVKTLFDCGLRWRLTKDDIEFLNGPQEDFQSIVLERELLLQYFTPGNSQEWTATQVKVYIEHKTQQRMNVIVLGRELVRAGFESRQKRINGSKSLSKVYKINVLGDNELHPPAPQEDPDDLPF